MCILLVLVGLWGAFYCVEPNVCNDPPDTDMFEAVHNRAGYRLLKFRPPRQSQRCPAAVLFVHGHAGSYRQVVTPLMRPTGD